MAERVSAFKLFFTIAEHHPNLVWRLLDKQVAAEDEETGRIRLENPPVYDEFVQGGDHQGLLSEEKEEQEQVVVIHRRGMEVCTVCGVRYV